MNADNAMIELSGIDLKLAGQTLFTDFAMRVARGETAVLFAPSGKGKTSLLHIMMGFLQPDSGTVRIGGETLDRDTVGAIRRRICYIGQDAMLPDGRVDEVLDEIARYSANKQCDFSDERIGAVLEAVLLPGDVREKHVEALSGGERRRLAFALCVLMDRDIWLLDEITTGLDEERKRAVMAQITGSGKTVMVISHDEAWTKHEGGARD